MSPIASSSSSQQANQSGTAGMTPATDPLANESTFLTLLVSQLQNQDPLNPTDSNEFVSQLTGYSQLEQLIQIRENTAPQTSQATSTGSSSSGTQTPPTQGATGN